MKRIPLASHVAHTCKARGYQLVQRGEENYSLTRCGHCCLVHAPLEVVSDYLSLRVPNEPHLGTRYYLPRHR